jgi:16S rRNA processing protein RimM
MTRSKAGLSNSKDQSGQPTGSQMESEPVFLVVGKLRRPHGIHGEIIMDVLTDFPERLLPGVKVYVGESHSILSIRNIRNHSGCLLIGFDSINNPETAGEFANQLVYVRADDRPPLSQGEYYHHELIGLCVVSDDGLLLGLLSSFLPTGGATPVFVIRSAVGQEILIPWTDEIVREVNLIDGEIIVHLIPGLLPE